MPTSCDRRTRLMLGADALFWPLAAGLALALPTGSATAAAPLFETTGVSCDAEQQAELPHSRDLASPNGDMLIFAEKRNDGPGDIGNHDIVLKRSADKGKTWSDEQVILDDGDRVCTDITVGCDRSNGKLWLFFLRDKKEFVYLTSADSGRLARPDFDSRPGDQAGMGQTCDRQERVQAEIPPAEVAGRSGPKVGNNDTASDPATRWSSYSLVRRPVG